VPRRRCPSPREPRPLTNAVVALTALTTVYLVVASACQPELTRHVPDGSCHDRVVYQTARLSDC
jgi:hypothetical protein